MFGASRWLEPNPSGTAIAPAATAATTTARRRRGTIFIFLALLSQCWCDLVAGTRKCRARNCGGLSVPPFPLTGTAPRDRNRINDPAGTAPDRPTSGPGTRPGGRREGSSAGLVRRRERGGAGCGDGVRGRAPVGPGLEVVGLPVEGLRGRRADRVL